MLTEVVGEVYSEAGNSNSSENDENRSPGQVAYALSLAHMIGRRWIRSSGERPWLERWLRGQAGRWERLHVCVEQQGDGCVRWKRGVRNDGATWNRKRSGGAKKSQNSEIVITTRGPKSILGCMS